MNTINPKITSYGYGEISPFDDYVSVVRDGKTFNGYKQSPQSGNWASDTSTQAKRSVNSHLLELPLKIASYFILHSDFKDSIWARVISSTEDLTGTLGDMFRNQIYSHRDSSGKYDDNLGAELFADGAGEENSKFSLGVINNFFQTKIKFLLVPLSIINPELANDIEWAVVRMLDNCWWAKMGTDRAFGNGFWAKAYNRVFNSSESEDKKLSFKFISDTLSKHFGDVKTAWSQYRNTSDNRHLFSFYDSLDRTVSMFAPITNCLNVIGDFGRPIARRLGVEGFTRNTFRIFTVVDKPMNWVVNICRYYAPELIQQRNSNTTSSLSDSPHTLLATTIGDMIDFGSIVFEDKLKESSGMINHLVEIVRRTTNCGNDIYFSGRRRRAQREISNEKTSLA